MRPASAAVVAQMREMLTDRRPEVVTTMTLVTFLVFGPRHPFALSLVAALCVPALAIPALRRLPVVWFTIMAAMAGGVLIEYHSSDNHKYLMAYWALAVFLSLHASHVETTLARAARMLIPLVMGLAVLAKLISPDYLSHGFFRHVLLFDPRFRSVADLLGVDSATREANKLALAQLSAGFSASAAISWTPGIDAVARFLTWWTVAIEGFIAFVFFAPTYSWAGRIRDVVLVAFLATTYTLATVMGFGYILATLGLAQARTIRIRIAYVAVFGVIQLYGAQWRIFLD